MARKSVVAMFALLMIEFLWPMGNNERAWQQLEEEHVEQVTLEPTEPGWEAALWAAMQQRLFWVAAEVLLLLFLFLLRRRRAARRWREAAWRAEAEARRRKMEMEQRKLQLKQSYKEIKDMCMIMDVIQKEMTRLICMNKNVSSMGKGESRLGRLLEKHREWPA